MATTVKFKNEFASALLVVWDNSSATISNLYSRKRRYGFGTEVIKQIVEFADNNNLRLILKAEEYGRYAKPDNSKLTKFYEKFGFVLLFHENGKPSPIMMRDPFA